MALSIVYCAEVDCDEILAVSATPLVCSGVSHVDATGKRHYGSYVLEIPEVEWNPVAFPDYAAHLKSIYPKSKYLSAMRREP